MSMRKLSTELDDIIIQHLSQRELAAVSRTSKYYHALAEPYLYKDLVLSSKVDVMRLMLTVLKHGKKIYIAPLHESILGKATEIWDIIQQVTLPLHDDTFTTDWFDCILQDNICAESALALLLTLSTNLKYLDLRLLCLYQDHSIMRRVLSAHWRNPDDNNADYPFSKLKELDMDTDCQDVLVLPSMTTVRATGGWGPYTRYTDVIFRTPYGFQNSFGNLRVLKLEYMNSEPASVGGLLPHLRQLKQLRVCNTYLSTGPQHVFKFLSQALSNHVPDLEVFQWSGHKYWESDQVMILPLGSLKDLSKLTELAVDIELFTGHDPRHLPPHLTESDGYLPAGLKALLTTGVPRVLMKQLIKRLEKTTVMNFVHRTTKGTDFSTGNVLSDGKWDRNSAYNKAKLSERSRYSMREIAGVLADMGTLHYVSGAKEVGIRQNSCTSLVLRLWSHWGDV